MSPRRLVSTNLRLAASVSVMMLFVLLAFAGCYWLSLYAISASQHKWCTTLELLTASPAPKPADPAANPSRERAYLFDVHLKDLERKFGC